MKARAEAQAIMDAYLGISPTYKQKLKVCRDKRDSVVRIVREEMRKFSPQKSWEDLSKYEQDYFVFVHIRGRMLRYIEKIFDKKARDKVERNIEIESKKRMLESQKAALLHNEQVRVAYASYDTSTLSEQEAQELYQTFCRNMKKANNECPIPLYEEWREQTRKQPMRPYDYIMSFCHEPLCPGEDLDKPHESAVDHVVLHTLLKYLSDTQGITINIPDIKECLANLSGCDIRDFSLLDPGSIATHQYFAAKEKLDNLDFIIKN